MSINLFIMRHGEAQGYASSDAARQLTEQGRSEVLRNALWLSQQVNNLDLVLVSPYIRAQQTQQIVCESIDAPTRLETIDALVPEGRPANVHDYVDACIELYQPKNILLVAHMPIVSYLVESFSIEKETPIFPTAAIAHIDYDAKKMKGHFSYVKAP
jgi:phosphohistidine phosphatase